MPSEVHREKLEELALKNAERDRSRIPSEVLIELEKMPNEGIEDGLRLGLFENDKVSYARWELDWRRVHGLEYRRVHGVGIVVKPVEEWREPRTPAVRVVYLDEESYEEDHGTAT